MILIGTSGNYQILNINQNVFITFLCCIVFEIFESKFEPI